MPISEFDQRNMSRAVALALQAEIVGNLPIGAVISLNGEIVGQGANAIWHPRLSLCRHAEMEALRSVRENLWLQAESMTLYTTLEPCLMCLGGILLYGIGRVVYGSRDPFGGAEQVDASLPPFFRERFARTEWLGPAFPGDCDPLYERIKKLEKVRGLDMD